MKKYNIRVAAASLMLAVGLLLQSLLPDLWFIDFISGLMIGGSIVLNVVNLVNYNQNKQDGKFRKWKRKLIGIDSEGGMPDEKPYR